MITKFSFNQFVDINGVPYVSGSLTFYRHGTLNPAQHTFRDSQFVTWTNVFRLDARGCVDVYANADEIVDVILRDSKNRIIKSWDNINLIDAFDASEIEQHIANHNNPHQVTAEQVGAYDKESVYTKSEVESRISEIESGIGTYLGTMEPLELNRLIAAHVVHKNDFADMDREGTIIWQDSGITKTLVVSDGDCVIFNGSDFLKRRQKRFGILVQSGSDTFYVGSY